MSNSTSYLLNRFIDGYLQTEDEKKQAERELGNDPTKSKLVRLILKRIGRNQDCRIVVTGEGGIGKSTFEMRMGEILNPELYVEQIEIAVNQATSFTAKEYMTGVRTLPSESQLSFDEPGQAWYHRQFMSEASMILSKTMIGFRYKKFKSFLTLPNLDLLDADALRLVNFLVYVSDQGVAEVYRILVQKFGGPPRYKKIIDRLDFSKPDSKLWHLYEKRKFRIQDELYDSYGRKLDDMDHPQLTNSEILKQVQDNLKKYTKNGRINVPAIQRDYKIGLNRGYLIKAMLDDEGDESTEKADNISAEPASDLLKKVLE